MFEWLVIMSPVVFGFGSLAVINVAHAGLRNEEHGITHAIPSLLGTHIVYVAYALIIGFTYGWIILTFPVLLDPESIVAKQVYKTTGVPETFIVDREGLIRHKAVGPRDWANDETLEAFTQMILGS